MGKKKRLFIDKVLGGSSNKCPVCGEIRKTVKVVKSYKNEDTKSWRYNAKIENVCKCNSGEVFS